MGFFFKPQDLVFPSSSSMISSKKSTMSEQNTILSACSSKKRFMSLRLNPRKNKTFLRLPRTKVLLSAIALGCTILVSASENIPIGMVQCQDTLNAIKDGLYADGSTPAGRTFCLTTLFHIVEMGRGGFFSAYEKKMSRMLAMESQSAGANEHRSRLSQKATMIIQQMLKSCSPPSPSTEPSNSDTTETIDRLIMFADVLEKRCSWFINNQTNRDVIEERVCLLKLFIEQVYKHYTSALIKKDSDGWRKLLSIFPNALFSIDTLIKSLAPKIHGTSVSEDCDFWKACFNEWVLVYINSEKAARTMVLDDVDKKGKLKFLSRDYTFNKKETDEIITSD